MPDIWTLLEGLSKGVSEGDVNVGKGLAAQEKREEKERKLRQEEERLKYQEIDNWFKVRNLNKAQEEDSQKAFKSENTGTDVAKYFEAMKSTKYGGWGSIVAAITGKPAPENPELAYDLRKVAEDIRRVQGLANTEASLDAIQAAITPRSKEDIPGIMAKINQMLSPGGYQQVESLVKDHKENKVGEELEREIKPNPDAPEQLVSKPLSEQSLLEIGAPLLDYGKEVGKNLLDIPKSLYKGAAGTGEEFVENPMNTLGNIASGSIKGQFDLWKGIADLGLSGVEWIGKQTAPQEGGPLGVGASWLKEKLDTTYAKGEKWYDEFSGRDPEATASKFSEFLGGMGGKNFFKRFLPRHAENYTKYVASGRARAGESFEEIAKAAPADIATGLLVSAPIEGLSKLRRYNQNKLYETARSDPATAIRVNNIIKKHGGALPLGHASDSQKMIGKTEELTVPGSGLSQLTTRNIGAINKYSKTVGEKYEYKPIALAEEIIEKSNKFKDGASKAYEAAKSIKGRVQDEVLSPDQLRVVLVSAQKQNNGPSVLPDQEYYQKGHSYQKGDSTNRAALTHFEEMQNSLVKEWNNGKPTPRYFEIYKEANLPNYLDLLEFEQASNHWARKRNLYKEGVPTDPKAKMEWEQNVSSKLKGVIDEIDVTGKYREAKTYFIENVLPFQSEPQFWKAKKLRKNKTSLTEPDLSFLLDKKNPNAEAIFSMLSPEGKKQVIAMWIDSSVVETGKQFIRKLAKTDRAKNLPLFIRESTDPLVQKMVQEVEDAGRINTVLTHLEGSVTNKGSSVEVKSASKLRGFGSPAQILRTLFSIATRGVSQRAKLAHSTSKRAFINRAHPDVADLASKLRSAKLQKTMLAAQGQEEED